MQRWALILLLLGAVALIILVTDDKPRMTIGQTSVYDSDGDGWSDGYEFGYLGTSPFAACLRDDVDPSVQGWPPDFNNDGTVDITDIAEMGQWFGASVSYYYSWYLRRYDIEAEPMGDGVIDVSDILRAGAFFGRSC